MIPPSKRGINPGNRANGGVYNAGHKILVKTGRTRLSRLGGVSTRGRGGCIRAALHQKGACIQPLGLRCPRLFVIIIYFIFHDLFLGNRLKQALHTL